MRQPADPGRLDLRTGVRRVYYNGFWYSRSAFVPVSELHVNMVRTAVGRMLRDLRLLAVVFDEIYIPRSHLLTAYSSTHREILDQVTRSEDFKFLSQHRIVVSSLGVGEDPSSDTERIVARGAGIPWLDVLRENRSLRNVRNVHSTKVDSHRESRESLEELRKYGSLVNEHLGLSEVSELIKRANHGSTVFFHEKFVSDLRTTKLSAEVQHAVWAETNRIYMNNSAAELENTITFQDAVVEGSSARIDKTTGLEASLFSPRVVLSVLKTLLSSSELRAWLGSPIGAALEFRTSGVPWDLEDWSKFQRAYFGLLDEVGRMLRPWWRGNW